MVLLKIKQKDEENKTIKVFTLKIKDKYLRPKKLMYQSYKRIKKIKQKN